MKYFLIGLITAMPGIILYFIGVYRWGDWGWMNPMFKDDVEKIKNKFKRKRK